MLWSSPRASSLHPSLKVALHVTRYYDVGRGLDSWSEQHHFFIMRARTLMSPKLSHMRAAVPGQLFPSSGVHISLSLAWGSVMTAGDLKAPRTTLGWEMTAPCCCWQDFSSLTAWAGTQQTFTLKVTFLNLTESVLRTQGKQPSYAMPTCCSSALLCV